MQKKYSFLKIVRNTEQLPRGLLQKKFIKTVNGATNTFFTSGSFYPQVYSRIQKCRLSYPSFTLSRNVYVLKFLVTRLLQKAFYQPAISILIKQLSKLVSKYIKRLPQYSFNLENYYSILIIPLLPLNRIKLRQLKSFFLNIGFSHTNLLKFISDIGFFYTFTVQKYKLTRALRSVLFLPLRKHIKNTFFLQSTLKRKEKLLLPSQLQFYTAVQTILPL